MAVGQGRYRYVRYDRRNGPIHPGTPMSWLDLKTFEVTRAERLEDIIGVSLIATKWTRYEQMMWLLTGMAELGEYSPVRFFFIQESGFIQHVA